VSTRGPRMSAAGLRATRAATDRELQHEAMRTAAVVTTLAADVLDSWASSPRRQAIVRRIWPDLGRVLDVLATAVLR
jgi:hypothetical protein